MVVRTALVWQFLDGFSVKFQQAGYTSLIYDARGWGESGGTPRNEVDPYRQIGDYYDAVDFVYTLLNVDSSQTVYWGSSMSGGIVLQAAAFDRRIVQAPFVWADAQVSPMFAAIVADLFKARSFCPA